MPKSINTKRPRYRRRVVLAELSRKALLSRKANRVNVGGRPVKPDKQEWGKITCILKLKTIEQLREGAGSDRFGAFLQEHLDRFPLSTERRKRKRKRMPVIMGEIAPSRQDKLAAKEAVRREKLTPEARAWEDSLRAAVTKSVEEYAGDRA